MIANLWKKMDGEPLAEGYGIKEIEPPAPNNESMAKCRELCSQNLCGSFNVNWGCPPGVGSEKECMDIVKKYANAAVITRKFENVDLNDKSNVEKIAKGHQELCRRFAHLLRGEGYDILPLADGGCAYCNTCSYPDSPCRFPDQRVTSISCYGILMDEYMNSQGVDFSFEKDSIALYGIMLYNNPSGK